MPRVARLDVGDFPYHVINRAVMRLRIFDSPDDYQLFEDLMADAGAKTGMRILAYCLMPNHWHLLLYPEKDGDLSRFMHQLTNAHTRQFRTRTGTIGTGPLYQGRYKSLIIENDTHLYTVLKYVERNAVRAGLVRSTEDWHWGSAWQRIYGRGKSLLAPLPVPLHTDYRTWINSPEQAEELKGVRSAIAKSSPYGKPGWVETMVSRFHLETTQRDKGRPRK